MTSEVKTGSHAELKDRGSIKREYSTAVKAMLGQNIVSGKKMGLYEPKGVVSRAETAVILKRFMDQKRIYLGEKL